MKKLLLFAAAAVASLSMTAQTTLYATGDFAESTWDAANPIELTYDSSTDLYSFSLTGSQFKLSTAKGDWTAFDGGALQASGTIEPGNTYTLSSGTGNIMLGWQGDWTVTVSLTNMTISATTTTEKPTGYTPVYIRGVMNDWGADAAWQFTTEDGVNYSLADVTIPKSTEFKIADGNWGTINYGGQTNMQANTYYTLTYNSSTNCTLAVEFTGTVEFNVETCKVRFLGEGVSESVIYFDNTESQWDLVYCFVATQMGAAYEEFPGEEMDDLGDGLWSYTVPAGYVNAQFSDGGNNKTKNCTVKDGYIYSVSDTEGQEYKEPVDYSSWYVNVPGTYNGWTDNGAACDENGVAVVYLEGATGTFKIKIWNGSEDLWFGNGATVALDTPIVVDTNSADMTFPTTSDGLGNLKVTFDCSTMTLTISENVIDYSTYYVNFCGDWNEWAPDGVQPDENYVGTATYEIAADEPSLAFKVKVWTGTTDAWYSTGEEVALDTPITIKGNNDVNMTLPESVKGMKVTMSFNVVTKTLTVTATAGVDGIEVENNAAAEYFNLQGVRVEEPTTGLYIVRRGNEVTKEVVR